MGGKVIETVLDLFDGPIFNVSYRLGIADVLVRILQDKYFGSRADIVRDSKILQYDLIRGYEEVQALLIVLRDQTFDALKEIEETESIDYKKIKACVDQKDGGQ